MINAQVDELISPSEAAALMPNGVTARTINRWRMRGVRGRVLESVMIGGRAYTTREALRRFCGMCRRPRRCRARISGRNVARERKTKQTRRRATLTALGAPVFGSLWEGYAQVESFISAEPLRSLRRSAGGGQNRRQRTARAARRDCRRSPTPLARDCRPAHLVGGH